MNIEISINRQLKIKQKCSSIISDVGLKINKRALE